MNGYSATHFFPKSAIELFDIATRLVAEITEPANVDDIRCHELTRAVHAAIANTAMPAWTVLTVVDGHFGIVDHSWLEIVLPRYSPIILDCYSVARLPMVQLVDPAWVTAYPHGAIENYKCLYKAGKLRTDIDSGKVKQLAEAWLGRKAE